MSRVTLLIESIVTGENTIVAEHEASRFRGILVYET